MVPSKAEEALRAQAQRWQSRHGSSGWSKRGLAEKREAGKLGTALHAMRRSPNAILARGPISSSPFPTGKSSSLPAIYFCSSRNLRTRHTIVTPECGTIWGKAFVNHAFITCGVRKNKDRGAVQPRFGSDDRLPWKLTSAICA